MALQDILQAITDEADRQIREAKTEHKKRMTAAKDEHDKRLTAALRHIAQQKDQRKHSIRARAEAQADMVSRHAVLRKKQELLDTLYDGVIAALAAMPKDKIEAFLSSHLSSIRDKGTVHPAKGQEELIKKLVGDRFKIGESVPAKGGFRFVGEKQDVDCTFEFLVREHLRPATEIDAAHKLFPSR